MYPHGCLEYVRLMSQGSTIYFGFEMDVLVLIRIQIVDIITNIIILTSILTIYSLISHKNSSL